MDWNRRLRVTLVFALLGWGWATVAMAQPEPSCDLRDLRGNYVFSVQGFAPGPDRPPIGVVGTFSIDRRGNLTGIAARNEAGAREAPAPFGCTLTMTGACLASGPCNDEGAPSEVFFDLAFVPGGDELKLLVSPSDGAASAVAVGSATRR